MSQLSQPSADAARPRPDLDDPLWGPHWRGIREHELRFQQCDACGTLRWPPAPLCPNCLEPAHGWTACQPEGTIWSVAIYEHAYHPGFRAQLPYGVVLVGLDCGINYISRICPDDLDRVAPDQRVTGVFVELEPGLVLLEFELVRSSSADGAANKDQA